MPYPTLDSLPDGVKKLPKHAQEIYQKTFNSAWEQHKGEDNAEARCHSIAWGAVKKSYKQVDDNWVAKESKEVTMANIREAELSAEDTRRLLQGALDQQFPSRQLYPTAGGAWIRDIYESDLVYEQDSQAYKVSYTMTDGKVTFGKPTKVMATTVYKPIESLQSTYSEIIQEVGRRNAARDSARVKKILELCQELLSSEDEPDDKKIASAQKEAVAVLELIKAQEATKTEDGQSYPAVAFAYVPDVDTASGWKLRLWEDPEKKVTRAQLGRAAAALSPGGFREQKVAIPTSELAAVKRKIRSEYRKLDVEDEDIPRWVNETLTRELVIDFVPLTEAKFDKGRATVIVIRPGFNATEDRYYPAEMLKRDYKVFEGQKMYADHPTEQEDKDRPERSIKDWVATLSDVTVDESGVVTGVAEIVEPWLMQKLAALRDKKMLSEMGISINAIGSASKGTIDGKETLVIEKLVAARSVDFVTEPGAGGIVTMYESDRGHDVDLIELATLRERRPDLIKLVETGIREGITREVKKAMENEELIKEKDTQIETLTKERDDLKEAAEKAKKAKAIAEAQATIKEAVDKAELPEAAKEVILKRFATAESAEGITEAIQAEIDYIAKLAESGKVRGLGPTKPDTEKDTKALRESWKAMHPEWNDAQLETAMTGR